MNRVEHPAEYVATSLYQVLFYYAVFLAVDWLTAAFALLLEKRLGQAGKKSHGRGAALSAMCGLRRSQMLKTGDRVRLKMFSGDACGAHWKQRDRDLIANPNLPSFATNDCAIFQHRSLHRCVSVYDRYEFPQSRPWTALSERRYRPNQARLY